MDFKICMFGRPIITILRRKKNLRTDCKQFFYNFSLFIDKNPTTRQLYLFPHTYPSCFVNYLKFEFADIDDVGLHPKTIIN